MAVVFDEKSESGFVFGSVLEFIKCWEAGSDSRLVLETINGKAWVNFSCCLGRPYANHVVTKKPKSPRKEFRDNMRAAAYNEKLRKPSSDVQKEDVLDEQSVAVTAQDSDVANVTLVSDDAADNELDFIECTVGVSLEESINNAEREQLRVIFEGTLKKSIEGIRVGSKIDQIKYVKCNDYEDKDGKQRILFTFEVASDDNDKLKACYDIVAAMGGKYSLKSDVHHYGENKKIDLTNARFVH